MSSEEGVRWFCPPTGWMGPACVQFTPELPSLESTQWAMLACGVHGSPGRALAVIGVAIPSACFQMPPHSLSPKKAQQRNPGGSRCKGLEDKEDWECLWPEKQLAFGETGSWKAELGLKARESLSHTRKGLGSH